MAIFVESTHHCRLLIRFFCAFHLACAFTYVCARVTEKKQQIRRPKRILAETHQCQHLK